MKIIDEIKLDINRLDEVDLITVKQFNEYTNQLNMQIFNNNEIVDLTGCNVRLYLIRPDKTDDFIDVEITNAIEGKCCFVLSPDLLYKSGNLKFEIIIYHNEEVAISKMVVIQIQKSIFNQDNIVKSEPYSALTNALNKVEVILSDDTIYIPGPQGEQGLPGEPGKDGLNGVDGKDGINGIDGKDGKSAYEIAVEHGFQGSEEEWLESLKGKDGVGGEGGSVDLSNYYNKQQVDEKITNIQLTPGPQGEKGEKGEPGIQGPIGLTGPKGDTGLQGPAGEQGPKGEPGEMGPAGKDGINGIDGKSAYELAVEKGFIGDIDTWLKSLKGEQGIQGEKGERGEQGLQGIQGLKGDKGETGAQGIQGIAGPEGPQGPKGDKGDTGLQGPKGEQGIPGIQGPAGKDGINGKSAYQIATEGGFVGSEEEWLLSLKGEKGEQGLPGIQGPQGERGLQGLQGLQGPKGDTGEKGEKGEQGIAGPQGPKGDTGETGPQGIQGPKGEKGDKGDTGLQGLQGEKGETGAQGPAGKDGKSVELQKTTDYIQWKQTDGQWNNLISIAEITGPQGPAGEGGTGSSVDVSNLATKDELNNLEKYTKLTETYPNWKPNTQYQVGDRVTVMDPHANFYTLQAKTAGYSSNNVNLDLAYGLFFIVDNSFYIDLADDKIYEDNVNLLDSPRGIGITTLTSYIGPLELKIKNLESSINGVETKITEMINSI